MSRLGQLTLDSSDATASNGASVQLRGLNWNAGTISRGSSNMITTGGELAINGNTSLGGGTVAAVEGFFDWYAPTPGQIYQLVSASSLSAQSVSFDLPALSGNLRWDTSTFATNGSIQAVPEPTSLMLLGLGSLGLLTRRRQAAQYAHSRI